LKPEAGKDAGADHIGDNNRDTCGSGEAMHS